MNDTCPKCDVDGGVLGECLREMGTQNKALAEALVRGCPVCAAAFPVIEAAEIAGYCPFCLETRQEGEEQKHQLGCAADPALMKKLSGLGLKAARPS